MYQKCIQTLHCYWHEGYRADIKVIARQALTTTVCDKVKLLNAKATRWEEAQAVAASLRHFPLTWRRNTQIQIYWLWKWLESYNICTFSTWKDKCLFNLLFWIPNFFCTFHDLVGEELTSFPPLTARHWFFIIQIFEQLACPEKSELPWNFSLCWNIFLSFRTFEQLVLSLKNRVCPENFHWIEIFFIFQDFWGTWACPENRDFPEIFHCIEYSFYIQDFWATCACLEKHSVPWIHCIEYIFLIIQNFEQPALALKNKICPEFFQCIEIFFIIQDFWGTWACPENRVCPEFFKLGGQQPPSSASYATVCISNKLGGTIEPLFVEPHMLRLMGHF